MGGALSPGDTLFQISAYAAFMRFLCASVSPTALDLLLSPCSGVLRTQKLMSHLVRTQSLNVVPLKPGVGQYITIHVTLTARDFFLAYFYPSCPFTCIFPKPLPIFLCWLWLTHGYCVGLQNKIGHLACQMQVPVLSTHGI